MSPSSRGDASGGARPRADVGAELSCSTSRWRRSTSSSAAHFRISSASGRSFSADRLCDARPVRCAARGSRAGSPGGAGRRIGSPDLCDGALARRDPARRAAAGCVVRAGISGTRGAPGAHRKKAIAPERKMHFSSLARAHLRDTTLTPRASYRGERCQDREKKMRREQKSRRKARCPESAAKKTAGSPCRLMEPSIRARRCAGHREKPIPRTEVTKKLWAYIKRTNCRTRRPRMIRADDALNGIRRQADGQHVEMTSRRQALKFRVFRERLATLRARGITGRCVGSRHERAAWSSNCAPEPLQRQWKGKTVRAAGPQAPASRAPGGSPVQGTRSAC